MKIDIEVPLRKLLAEDSPVAPIEAALAEDRPMEAPLAAPRLRLVDARRFEGIPAAMVMDVLAVARPRLS